VSIESRIDIVVKNLNQLNKLAANLQNINKTNTQLVKGLGRVEARLAKLNNTDLSKAERSLNNMRQNVDKLDKATGTSGIARTFQNIGTTVKAAAESFSRGFSRTALTSAVLGIGKIGLAGGALKSVLAGVSGQWTLIAAAMMGFGPQIVSSILGISQGLIKVTGGLKNLGKSATETLIGITGGVKNLKLNINETTKSFQNMLVGASLSELNMHVGSARKEMESFWHMTRGAEEAAKKLALAMAAQKKEQAALNKLLLQAQGKSTASAADRAAHKTSAKYRQRQLDMGWNLGSYTDQEGQQQYMWRKASLDIAKQDVQLAEERLKTVLEEEKSAARSKKFREMTQRQARKDKQANIDSRFRENLMLGVGFPMLFGGGVGAIAGGASGAMLQKKMGTQGGFGAQILLSAAGQAFDSFVSQTVQSVTKLGQALTSVGGTFDMMTERSLFSSDATRIHAKNLLAQGKRTEAAALMTKELTKALGPNAIQDLQELGEKSKELSKKWGVLKTQMELLLVGPLTEMIELLNKIVSRETAKNKLSNTMQESQRLGVGNSIDAATKDVIAQEVSKLGGTGKLDRYFPGEQEMVGGLGGIDVNALDAESILKIVEALEKYNKSIEKYSTASKGKVGGILPSVEENNETFQAVEEIIRSQEKLNEKTKIEEEIANAINKEARVEAKLKLAILDIEGEITNEQRERLRLAIEAGDKTEKVKVTWEEIKDVVATGLTDAVMGLIEGTKSLGESLASIAKSIGRMFLNAAFQNMMPASLTGAVTGAEGGYWTNGIKPFASGGLVTRPTIGLVGEAGEDEYIIPASKMSGAMDRYSAGARGQAVIPGGGTVASGSGVSSTPTVVNYTGPVLSFNSEAYVPKSAIPEIINSAARRGAQEGQSKVFSQLKNSRSQRSRVGL